ncbi:MAG TPA: thioredoxin-disulfide reductase [Candidatus Goldiibacteriota bacterium]|nr:thioredoxin-disulfide reductase [Candidatus Goldiibacteriota bacterium]HRQ43584.1 thioredoxin-disulfide reductase [Candidatus Goldiibacteriota bacterium]
MDTGIIINLGNSAGESVPNKADVIIIGGGPAGLTAAIYNCRAGLKVMMIEKMAVGGQIFLTAEIENYPGYENISGPELIQKMEKQADNFGLIKVFDEVLKIESAEKGVKKVHCASGAVYESKVIIAATGARYRDIGVPGETEFRGRGVSNCATCDGAFYRNLEVAVVGGGDTAVEEGIYLTKFASKVHIIHRRDRLRAAKIIQERAFKNPKISFIYDSVVTGIFGSKGVDGVKVKNVKTGAESDLKVSGVFVFIGLVPGTEFLKGTLEMDGQGYIKTDADMKTSVEGIFACGDCVSKKLRQAITAAGDGAAAAYSAEHYIEKLEGTEYV